MGLTQSEFQSKREARIPQRSARNPHHEWDVSPVMCTDIRRPIHVSTRALGHNSPSEKDCHPRKVDSEKIQGDIRRPIHVSTRALGHNSPSETDCHPRKVDSEKIQGDRPRNQRAGASAHRNVVAVGGTRARESTFLRETPTPLAHKHLGSSLVRPSPGSSRRCLANVSDERMRPPHPVSVQLERLLWCEFEKTVAAEKGEVVKHSVSNAGWIV